MAKKKNKAPKCNQRMYSEREVKSINREVANNATSRMILMSIVVARDMFSMDEETTIKFVETMHRYAEYETMGIVSLSDFSESLYDKTGIDLRLKNRR